MLHRKTCVTFLSDVFCLWVWCVWMPLETRSIWSPRTGFRVVVDYLICFMRTKFGYSAEIIDIVDSRASSTAWTQWVLKYLLSYQLLSNLMFLVCWLIVNAEIRGEEGSPFQWIVLTVCDPLFCSFSLLLVPVNMIQFVFTALEHISLSSQAFNVLD